MSIWEVALRMWPFWLMGVAMLVLTYRSEHRNLIRIEPKGIFKFCKILAVITIIRMIMFKLLMPDSMAETARSVTDMIPIPVLLSVFWEDACHTLPLALAGAMWGTKKFYPILSKIALVVVMLAFGSGHIYQGLIPACAICVYIPYTLSLGKKFGFGTVMICHIMYDMATLLSLKWMLG